MLRLLGAPQADGDRLLEPRRAEQVIGEIDRPGRLAVGEASAAREWIACRRGVTISA